MNVRILCIPLIALCACAQPTAPQETPADASEGATQSSAEALSLFHADRTEYAVDTVERQMVPAGDAYPERLRGIFWLDGIQIPDIAATFAGASWDAATRTAYVDVTGDHVWAWDASPAGQALYEFCRLVKLHYKVSFNEDFTYGRATPVLDFALVNVNVPNFVTDFELKYQGEGVWLRETHLFNGPASYYYFRRIVEGDGTRTPGAYDKYLKEAASTGYLFDKSR